MSTFLSFLQFEHRKVAIEKAREQYTDDAERKSKFFWSCLASVETGCLCNVAQSTSKK